MRGKGWKGEIVIYPLVPDLSYIIAQLMKKGVCVAQLGPPVLFRYLHRCSALDSPDSSKCQHQSSA